MIQFFLVLPQAKVIDTPEPVLAFPAAEVFAVEEAAEASFVVGDAGPGKEDN